MRETFHAILPEGKLMKKRHPADWDLFFSICGINYEKTISKSRFFSLR